MPHLRAKRAIEPTIEAAGEYAKITTGLADEARYERITQCDEL